MTCAVCAWTMLADSDMSPVYTLPLVLCALLMCYLQVDWKKLGKCQKVIQHSQSGGGYGGVAVSSDGLLAVADCGNACVHLLRDGAFLKSIGKEVLGSTFRGITFDLEGNVWVADMINYKVHKLSQNDKLLQTIHHADSEIDRFDKPTGVSVSPEGSIYICDGGNHRVTVHDAEGMFLFAFGSKGSGPRCFDRPRDVTFGSDDLVYITDEVNDRVCVWSKEGSYQRDFKTRRARPRYITSTHDNYLLIPSKASNTVMVYKDDQLVHKFGGSGSDPRSFRQPNGICVDDSGAVYVADSFNKNVQVF